MEKGHVPKILLIGAGAFGKNYIRVLKELDAAGKLQFMGIVVKSRRSVRQLAGGVKVFRGLKEGMLRGIDAAIVATPPETHYQMIKKCLQYVHVFAEKPLATDASKARELGQIAERCKRVLMCGHIFRFHPVVVRLKKLIKGEPSYIRGEFVNPASADTGREISMELLHLYDILDFLFEKNPDVALAYGRKRIHNVSLRYPYGIASFRLGWTGDEKRRKLDLHVGKKQYLCNLNENVIKIIDRQKRLKISCRGKEPLVAEVLMFLDTLKGKKGYPDAEVGTRIVDIVRSVKHVSIRKPKIAVIGGGIFGTNCALQLGDLGEVTLFERHDDLLTEASYVNVCRHHWGFHYPRSVETVNDIKDSKRSFESMYRRGLIRNFPTYYCVTKKGSKVSAKDYLQFCKDNKLSFKSEDPDPLHVDMNAIDLSLKTWEPIYDFSVLFEIVKKYLDRKKSVTVKLGSEVVGGRIESNGQKTLVVKKSGKTHEESFDYVLNVTYANLNQFAYWFNFPIKPLRLDMTELLILDVPIPRIGFAIMDGPFTNLVPISEDNLFTLYHIKYSNLRRDVPFDGLVPKSWKFGKSNKKQILEESIKYLPILKEAKFVESRWVYRGVNAYQEHDDARPSDIINHGFGCWSILGGKIINCVSTAKNIRKEIKLLN